MNVTAAACPVIVTDDRTLHLVTPAELVTDVESLGWGDTTAAFADKPSKWRVDQALLTGRFVQGGIANLNGHEYDAAELVAAHDTLVHTACNVGHDKPTVTGTFIATEVDDTPEARDLGGVVVNAAAVYWKRNRPDLWPDIEAAARIGLLAFSKESVAVSITCMDHCGQTFPYRGPTHVSYCEALQRIGPRARLNQPVFTGGALIVPPKRPGWAHAAIDSIIQAHAAEAEAVYDAMASRAPHLDAKDWERAMAAVLIDIYPDEVAAVTPTRIGAVAFDPIVVDLLAEATARRYDPVTVAATVGADASPTVADGPVSEPTGAVIVAELDDATRAALAGHSQVTEPEDELHCTLVFMGDADVDEEQVGINRFSVGGVPGRRVEAVASSVAALIPPLSGVVSGVVAWGEGDGSGVVVALVDVPALNEARSLLVSAMDASGVPVARIHGYTAHITVAKLDSADGVDVTVFDALKGMAVVLPTWGVWWGGTRRASYECGVGID